jgi:hypothetical protein
LEETARQATQVNFSDRPTGGQGAALSAMDAIAKTRLEALLPQVQAALVPEDVRKLADSLKTKLAEIDRFKFTARQRID